MSRLAPVALAALAVALPQPAHAQATVERTTVETTTTTYRRVVGTPVEVRAFDPATRTLVVLNGDRQQSFVVSAGAAGELATLAPGQQAFLSWRFDREGRAEAILRIVKR